MSGGYAGQPVSPSRAYSSNRQMVSGSGTTNLADLLERVLDKGIVIAGDITVSLGQVELLSIKLRLIVASIDKAQEIGIDWWRSDPALSSQAKQMERENEQLKARLDRVEQQIRALPQPQHTLQQSNDQAQPEMKASASQQAPQPETQDVPGRKDDTGPSA